MNFINWLRDLFTHSVDGVMSEFNSLIARLEALEAHHDEKGSKAQEAAANHFSQATKAGKVASNLKKLIN